MSNLRGLNNIVINSMDDFPVQDATTVTLSSFEYDIRVTLVTDKQFILENWAVIEFIGWDPSVSWLVYTWTLAAFKWTDFIVFTHDHVFISTPLWTIFDVNNVSAVAAQIFMEDTVYVDCSWIWIVKNIEQFSGYFNAFVDIWQWFNLESVRLINISQSTSNSWKNEISTMFTFDWDIDSVQLSVIEYIPNSNENVFDFKVWATIAWANITSSVYNKTLWWGLFAAWSREETDEFINFDANSWMPASIVFGNMTIPSVKTIIITSIWVPVIVNDANTGWTNIWTELWKTSRFTFSSSLWRYTYTWIEDVTVIVTSSSSIEKSWWGADTLSTLIAKNWIAVPESISTTENATATSVTSTAEIALSTWDFLELMVRNDTTTIDIDINTSNFIIKD